VCANGGSRSGGVCRSYAVASRHRFCFSCRRQGRAGASPCRAEAIRLIQRRRIRQHAHNPARAPSARLMLFAGIFYAPETRLRYFRAPFSPDSGFA